MLYLSLLLIISLSETVIFSYLVISLFLKDLSRTCLSAFKIWQITNQVKPEEVSILWAVPEINPWEGKTAVDIFLCCCYCYN